MSAKLEINQTAHHVYQTIGQIHSTTIYQTDYDSYGMCYQLQLVMVIMRYHSYNSITT